MSIQAAIYEHLIADTTVLGLVSTRVYVDVAPHSAVGLNHITYQVISAQHVHDLGAASGLVRKRIQIDVWATTSITRDSISEAIREAMDGYSGDMGAVGATVDVRDCYLDNEVDGYEVPETKNEFGIFRRTMDFMIWHTESVPTFT